MDKGEVGARIRQQRKLKGLTQQELANQIGISLMSIRRYETGERTITEKNLFKIASALDISFSVLLGAEHLDDEISQALERLSAAYKNGAPREEIEELVTSAMSAFDKREDYLYQSTADKSTEPGPETLKAPASKADSNIDVLIGYFNRLSLENQQKVIEYAALLTLAPSQKGNRTN